MPILPKERDPRLITVRRGGTLTDEHHRLLADRALLCAEHVLHLFEDHQPGDGRAREAIDAGRAWIRGEVRMGDAHRAAFRANAAARGMPDPAKFAALPAGQAVAVAHVAAHDLGAAAYAIRACGCRKPVPPGQMLCGTLSARSRERCLGGRSWFGLVCDDLRLVGLKLIFLVVTRAVPVLGLSRREAWWKDAGILMLRHRLAGALGERAGAHFRLTWPDRAWLLDRTPILNQRPLMMGLRE